MRNLFLLCLLLISLSVPAQKESDSMLVRCPIYITDTLTSNNYFLEFQPAILKIYRVKGKITVAVEQKDQFFTLFFHDNELEKGKYQIQPGSNGKFEVEAKYSFRSGEQVSYVDVGRGTVESTYDKGKELWHLKVNGMISNLVGRSISYYKVTANLYIKD